MPIRVKTLARRDSRESLSSTDHLIAVYSLESKDASFEACAAVDMTSYHPQRGGAGTANTTNSNSSSSKRNTSNSSNASSSASSWVKGPWGVCFPPQLHMTVQPLTDRLKLEPSRSKLNNNSTNNHTNSSSSKNSSSNKNYSNPYRSLSPTSNGSASTSSTSATAKQKNKSSRHHHHHPHHHPTNPPSPSHYRRHHSSNSSKQDCGYEYEHKEDTDGNIYVLPLEQTAFAFSDDDSAGSWSSQNAVKFNRKLKPKVADHGLSTTTNTGSNKEAKTNNSRMTNMTAATNNDPALYSWEWGTKPSDSSLGSLDDVVVEHRAPLSSSKDFNHNTNTHHHHHHHNSSSSSSNWISGTDKHHHHRGGVGEEREQAEAVVPPGSSVLSSESQAWSLTLVNTTTTDQGDDSSELQSTTMAKSTSKSGSTTLALANTRSQSLNTQQSSILMGSGGGIKARKSVRFTEPLVTCQYFRPKTRPEEVSLLYFDEDELELLEEDRETTSRDQFEMIAQELSENRLRISIAYQNRWRDHQRRRSGGGHSSSASSSAATPSSSGLLVANSASDV